MSEQASMIAPFRSRRPLGVWVFTVLYALSGVTLLDYAIPKLFPAPLPTNLADSGPYIGDQVGSPFDSYDDVPIGLPIFIGLAILISAIGAWAGDKYARNLMLALVTIN